MLKTGECKSQGMASRLQRWITVGLLLLLTGLISALRGPPKLSAYLGRTLSVACQYEEDYRMYEKYWCKGSDWGSCTIVVRTERTETEAKSGRTSIQDNQTRSEFIVRLENFSQEDAGIYWCGITRVGSDPRFHIEITALPAPTTVITTNVPTLPDSPTTPTPSPELLYMILLPIVFLVLVVILIGAVLLMCKLKKQRVAKACKDVPLSLAPSASVQQNNEYRHEAAAPSSNQGPDSAREVEYAFVRTAPAPVPSLPQVSTNTEDISYSSLKFSALEEEPTYANV